MNLKYQLCTFVQAKKLKELGIIQAESIFFNNSPVSFFPLLSDKYTTIEFLDANNLFSLFTCAELELMLSWQVYSKVPRETDEISRLFRIHRGTTIPDDVTETWYFYNQHKNMISYVSNYEDVLVSVQWKRDKFEGHKCLSEAEARADMLIYLLENNLTEVENCNKELISNDLE